MDLRREGRSPERRKSTVFYHKVTAILILFQLAIAICEKIDFVSPVISEFEKVHG